MSEKNTLTIIAEEIGRAFQPFTEAVKSPESFIAFMQELGWDLSQMPQIMRGLAGPLSSLADLLDDGKLDVAQLGDFVNTLRMFIQAVRGLNGQPNSVFTGVPDPDEFRAEFPEQLIQFLLVEYLLREQPAFGELFKMLGIIREEEVDATATRLAYVKKSFEFADFVQFFSDPLVFLKNAYDWGSSRFKAEVVFENAFSLAESYGIDVHQRPLPDSILNFLNSGAANLDPIHETSLRLALLPAPPDDLDAEVGLAVALLPEAGAKLPGFALVPYADGSFDEEVALSDEWALKLELAAEVSDGVVITVRPGEPIDIQTNLSGSATGAVVGGAFAVAISGRPSGGEKLLLLGSAEGSRFEVSSVSIKGGGRVHSDGSQEALAEFNLNDANIVIQPSDASDSFVSSLVPKDGLVIDFSLLVGLSTKQRLYFGGSGGLEVRLPTHISLGPIEIDGATLALKPDGSAIPVDLGANIKGNLGPLKAVVENMGLRAKFTFPDDRDGNLGPVNLELGFKPPNGVGLSIDAGAVKGGGYLFFDSDREEYAGALELVFSEWIGLKAIGLITTKMPDGSKGFSLFVIITVEFGSGIQLGFGFTLLGVGGLLGLQRIANVEPLKEGIRTGAVESVMFPQDVVANAPRIISDLRKFFPPMMDIFLVGPMAKIGWSTPPLVSVSLGVILEFPNVTITIFGVLKAILPHEKADILRLQVNFMGRVEPSNQLLWFYAELFDSRVLFITLEGGMGLLVNWSDNANFVISVGGFHPRYSPPPLPFPEPPRIAANILNESWARVRIEGYFAVTSNSVQFGARAELFFGVSEFKLEGHLGFDALFQFDPFFFSFSLSFSLSVKVFGIGLFSVGFSGLLEGPTPWHIKGKGKISLLFFSISVPFEHTWGESRQTKLDPIEVFPLLEEEFNALTNWRAVLPTSRNILVSLRKLGEVDTDQLVLHPVGKLRISQRKIPMDFKLDKVGNQRPSDVHRVSVDAAIPGGGSLSISERQEKFAIGQFKDLDDASRLSSPAFQPLEGGIEIAVAGEQMKTSQAVRRVIRYETIIIDNNFKRYVKSFFTFFTTGFTGLYNFLFGHFLTGNAVTKSVLSQHYKKRIQPFEEVIRIQPNQYSVAFNSNNKPVNAYAATFTSQAKANEYMQQQIQGDPNLENDLHVIPNSEVNIAA